ncbi:hypothetical protein [Salipaludibacillus daqingensis]|uniref:hypothetical protein n=1 Tax=Salipaludibacillus daqingensis TaxID=3041001 RepID=UPI0024733647|nr:hypothetical protein [Salipaludibacillus daqingensis]
MGKCNIDHTLEDVHNKYQSQREYLPETIADQWELYLKSGLSQLELNEAFHLLKKYDLASEDDQQIRESQMIQLFNSKKS